MNPCPYCREGNMRYHSHAFSVMQAYDYEKATLSIYTECTLCKKSAKQITTQMIGTTVAHELQGSSAP